MGANDRIYVGVIGVGNRSRMLMDQLPEEGQIVAICDCNRPRSEAAVQETGADWKIYDRHREMFDKENLDAVIVGTPDHGRVLPCIDACQAGLDIYAEKPLTLTIQEGRRLVDAVRYYKRILQVGSQQRTMEMNRFACELVRSGGIGKLKKVQGIRYPGPREYEGLPEQPIPPGNDWDTWLGPTEQRPYHRDLQYGWMQWRAYSGGEMTNWGAHGVDQIQWALGKSQTGPIEVWPVTPGPSGKVSMRYADGIQVDYELEPGPMGGGVFTGEKAKIEINRNKFVTNPPDFVDHPPEPAEAEKWEGPGWIAKPHLQNWLDSMRSRELPNADVEIGHRSITVCHLANIVRQLGRRLRWDPEQEIFPDDAEANEYLDRPRRAGWELPTIG